MSEKPTPTEDYFAAKRQKSEKAISCGCLLALSIILFLIFGSELFHDHFAAKKTQCLSNTKGLATALALYASDFDDAFPECRYRQGFGVPHGANDPIMGDILSNYIRSNSIFSCPCLKNHGPNVIDYDYFCVHETRGIQADSSPFLKMVGLRLLGKQSKKPLDLNAVKPGDERRAGTLASMFACGTNLSKIQNPRTQPLLMCDGLSAHFNNGPDRSWEAEFLPKELGGTGTMTEARTNIAFADAHARYVKGNYKSFTDVIFRPALDYIGEEDTTEAKERVGGVLPDPNLKQGH